MPNPWLAHVRRYRAQHGGTYHDALKGARASYRASGDVTFTMNLYNAGKAVITLTSPSRSRAINDQFTLLGWYRTVDVFAIFPFWTYSQEIEPELAASISPTGDKDKDIMLFNINPSVIAFVSAIDDDPGTLGVEATVFNGPPEIWSFNKWNIEFEKRTIQQKYPHSPIQGTFAIITFHPVRTRLQ